MLLLGGAHAATLADDCLLRNDWVCGRYLTTRSHELLAAVQQHIQLTVVSLLIGALVALPLALLARRWRGAERLVLGASTLIYSIPSLALFSGLLPFTGLSGNTVVIGLVLYSLTILVRNTVAGLAGVPAEVHDAAVGMGYGPRRLLWQVDLPLALPTIFAGLRLATVSTIALVTIGTVVGYGGLGNLLSQGLNSFFKAQVLTAAVLCVLLAVVADLLLLLLQRVLTPWARRAAS